jgi:hypothetical protein
MMACAAGGSILRARQIQIKNTTHVWRALTGLAQWSKMMVWLDGQAGTFDNCENARYTFACPLGGCGYCGGCLAGDSVGSGGG